MVSNWPFRPKLPTMFNITKLVKKPLEWLALRRAEKDTDTYLRLAREYSPEQTRRIWREIKKRRKKRWWKL